MQVEACEYDPHVRDDLQIARLTVHYAATGEAKQCSPYVLATYAVLGLHPEKVWPAIEARSKALLGRGEFPDAATAPKKPPQSVKLWTGKTNAARVSVSRGGEAILSDESATSVPMAAPSIAALSTNSGASKSEKLSRIERVRASSLPERYRSRLADLMEQFNFTGDELWMATDSCQKAIGRVCIRRKPGIIVRVRQGREEKCNLGSCEMISRRSVQRLLRDLVEVFGVLEVTHEANRWVKYGGESVFRHSRTYRLRSEKLAPRETYKQWRHRQAVTPIRRNDPPQPDPNSPPPKPPAAAPVQPQRKTAEAHRSTERAMDKPSQPKLTRRESAKFWNGMEQKRRGHTSYYSRPDSMMIALRPGDDGYAAPMSWKDAFLAECAAWGREPDAVRDSLKSWGYKVEPE
jgi:hypothetical protein